MIGRSVHAFTQLGIGLALLMPGPAMAAPFDLPDIPVCFEVTPGAVSIDRRPVTLNLRIILDSVGEAEAANAVAAAQAAYLPLDIHLNVSIDRAGFGTSDADGLINEAKRLYGGQRPGDTHAVYVLTSKNIHIVEAGMRNDDIVGLADCIGGVAYPGSAFAVGEVYPDDPFRLGYTFGRNNAGKILAHELGHLLGGHHHYANCAETIDTLDDAACTIMINTIDLAALRFSTLNGLVARGHAQLLPALSASSGSGGGGGALGLGLVLALLGAGVVRRSFRS